MINYSIKILINIILLVFFIVLSGCTCSKDYDAKIIDLDKVKKADYFLSDIADEVSYISLDEKCFFKYISTLKIYNNYIIIRSGNRILFYNRKGAFLNEIGKKGPGPGEFSNYMSDFVYDSVSNSIYVLDAKNNKIIVYSLKGNFIKDIPIKKNRFDRIEILNEKIYLFEWLAHGNATYDWLILDMNGDSISAKLNTIPTFKSGKSFSAQPYIYGNNIYDFDRFNDTIYKIDKNGYYDTEYIIKHSKSIRSREKHYQNDSYYRLRKMFETLNYVFLTYGIPGSYEETLLNKATGEYSIYYKTDLYLNPLPEYQFNDIDGGKWDVMRNHCIDDSGEYLCITHSVLTLKEYIKSDAFKKARVKQQINKKNYKKFVEGLKEDSNPVIMLVKLKK